MSEDILSQVNDWKRTRKAARFEISCTDKQEALLMQNDLKMNGFKGYVTTMGEWVGVVLYLNDNK